MLTMCKELQSDKRQYDQIIQCTDFAMITITITGAFNKCHHLLNIYFIPSPACPWCFQDTISFSHLNNLVKYYYCPDLLHF